MNRVIQTGILLVAIMPGLRVFAGEPSCGKSPHGWSFGQIAPVGGWSPCGGLVHWWSKCCFPNCGTCDDYCRKPLPRVCWPDAARYYTFGPPEICYDQYGCEAAGGKDCSAPVIKTAKR